jgi:hypothetical protein
MEVEVRVVGGARSCFVALPLHLIQALSRTSASGDLPPVLALDLRAAAGARWSLAWSGAASRSRAIEVSADPVHALMWVDTNGLEPRGVGIYWDRALNCCMLGEFFPIKIFYLLSNKSSTSL